MRCVVRGIMLGVTATFVFLSGLAVVTADRGDPKLWPASDPSTSTEIFVVSHGYHAGLALPTAKLALVAGRDGEGALISVAQRFASYPFIEIGWGDQGFYSQVPNIAALTWRQGLRALFWPGNPSVLHVVGLSDHPRKVFREAEVVAVPLSDQGFSHMSRAIEKSFTRDGIAGTPQIIGPGLYGPSLFYRATGHFHLFNVCNHWLARMLSEAGLPTMPVLATLPSGLLLDLKWRSRLDAMPILDGGRL